MEKVLITGGGGLIGKRLSHLLTTKGYDVIILSRKNKPASSYKTFTWDVKKQMIDDSAFKNLDHIIHLAGAGIADKRWSKERKIEIIDSRVNSTKLLYKTVKRLKTPLKSFTSASATGYYGSFTTDTIYTETDKPAKDFLGHVCQLWEKSIFEFQNLSTRAVALRTGIVLSNKGGALKKMITPVITYLGNGKQYIPWIHIDDLCEIYLKSIQDPLLKGAYNAVSPEHQTNKSFSKEISRIYKIPFVAIGAPKLILKIVFGEMSTIILHGSRISSKKIQQSGFKFKFKKLSEALKDLA